MDLHEDIAAMFELSRLLNDDGRGPLFSVNMGKFIMGEKRTLRYTCYTVLRFIQV
jgi:hypothetical protein